MRSAFLPTVFACLTSACVTACGRGANREAHAAVPPPVPAGTVTLTAAQRAFVTVEAAGARAERPVATVPAQIVYDEDHTARVFSPVTGRIDRLDARIGDVVGRGAPLAHVLSSDVAQAGADLAKADAAARQAITALDRARDLYAHGVIAQKELQQTEADATGARAEQDRASLRARLLGTQRSGTGGAGQTFVLRAPVPGEVLDRQVNPGSEVQPGGTTPLFVVSDLSTVWLTANLYQRDLASVRRGARLTFTSDALGSGPGDTVVARVAWISDALDPQTRTATLRAVLPNPTHRLRPATFGQATLYAADDAHTPAVPSAALVTRGGGTVVYVEDSPGRFRRREVTVGTDDGTRATITRGLTAGERVVGKGSLLVDAEAERQAATAPNGSTSGGEGGS